MNKLLRYLLLIILVSGLIMVRVYQIDLFYDPLLYFFEQNDQPSYLSNLNIPKHLISISLRYAINAILSIGIIYLLFEKKSYLKASSIIFLIGWLIFLPLYYYFIHTGFTYSLMLGFYIRRFLIQPIMGIILTLAFFYLKKSK